MSMDDSLRRLANQAFFDKLTVTDADTIDGQPGEPFNILFDSDVQRIAIERQHQTTESGRRTGNVVGLNNDHLVETRGLEPRKSVGSLIFRVRKGSRPERISPTVSITACPTSRTTSSGTSSARSTRRGSSPQRYRSAIGRVLR